MKKPLLERFQKLAGIKPLYEITEEDINEGHCYDEDGKPMPEAHCYEEGVTEGMHDEDDVDEGMHDEDDKKKIKESTGPFNPFGPDLSE